MKLTAILGAAILALGSIPTRCDAGTSAVTLIYQPILTYSEGSSPGMDEPKRFRIMEVPFLHYHYHGHPSYHAIVYPNVMLTDAPREQIQGNSNLLASSGVRVSTGDLGQEVAVAVDFSDLFLPKDSPEGLTVDDIAEATLECIRRMAKDAEKKPKLTIRGEKGEEAKWLKWQKQFEQQELAKPYVRPGQ